VNESAVDLLRVELGERSYPIWVGEGIRATVGERVRSLGFAGSVALVSVPPVYDRYGETVRRSLEEAGFAVSVDVVPDGEASKCLAELGRLYDRFVDHALERRSVVVALGGGVVGDLAGFAAATFKRGVPFVQCPTTLLSQVDSSVGGKVAIDHPLGKNLIGAFHQPAAVCIDLETLRTLERRDFLAGLAEVVRYGAAFDAQFFAFLEERIDRILALDMAALRHAVRTSCAIKARVVAADERETTGTRALLNLGHTFGHALETVTGYTKYRHGEAVAVGIVCAARLAVRLGHLAPADAARQEALLRRAGLPVSLAGENPDEIIAAMAQDKKIEGGRLKFVLTENVGRANIFTGIPREILREVLS
jgi:3-dehydroquinate synthase